ncbi:MAG: amidase family protein, partial [Rubrobacteraceae bacterium]
AFEIGAKTDDPLAMYLQDICAVPASLAGIPAISVPGGLSEGLPVGVQLMGDYFTEPRLLRTARAVEQASDFEFAVKL